MAEHLDDLSLARLCTPINGGSGEDLSFSSLFDQVKEARRADPDYLTQGDWQTNLKVSDWDLTVELASSGLAVQSKDLMLSAWLAEGLANKHHFAGVAFGLRLTDQLLTGFWPTLYPSLEEGIELRATRLAWLNTALAQVVGGLPITQDQGYGLARYEESKHVENLALQNPASMAIALNEGKINTEIFQRSAVLTDTGHLHLRAEQISECLFACRSVQNVMQTLMGHDAPSFGSLEDALTRTRQLVERLLKDRGIETVNKAPSEAPAAAALASIAEGSTSMLASSLPSQEALRTTPLTREEAFTMLTGVAQFFKQTEPHSPVPYLLERAIKWGNMPLESWLADVIKDSSVVEGIKEVLGTKGS
jgi:type VI secretion system protein ImpA